MSLPSRVHQALAFVLSTFAYDISNLDLLSEAIDTSGMTGRQSNKRLALVGDRALGIAMVAAWYPSGADKGCLNDLAISVHSDDLAGAGSNWLAQLSNTHLAAVAREIGLDQHLILNPGHVGRLSDATLATSLEAVMGAIYFDCGGRIPLIESVMRKIGINMPAQIDI
ncbi:hypothetical protein CBER1_09017 [Cercospora berteroae]|uniref:RNase III domain-containing protein n=1 Tax=Cercospora berteroae TaxID=357750 RepID=A0A2S6CC39_9PEZI|nr:hypothetical protein CBER1_09017 [Cercospora berteroae]